MGNETRREEEGGGVERVMMERMEGWRERMREKEDKGRVRKADE